MSTWADGPLIAFDFESTGVDVETARIVTATVIKIEPGREPVVCEWLVAVDDVEIPAEATEIHGVTTEYARAHGRPADEVVAEVADAIRSGWAARGILVGHSIGSYDLNLLDRESRRWLDRPFEVAGPVADSLCIDRAVDKYRKGSRKLVDSVEHYQVPMGTAHEATADAFGSARILWRMCQVYPALGEMSPRQLWTYQARAHREWAEHFTDYRRQKMRDEGASVAEIEAFIVRPEWPVWAPTAAAAEPEGTRP